MIITTTATVAAVLEAIDGLVEIEVDIEGRLELAIAFEELSGTPTVGDQVVLNITAKELRLGSGGYHFVVSGRETVGGTDEVRGHLMKLRYTPMQRAALSVEEPKSPYHEVLRDADDLAGHPVVACGLHSQLLPAAVMARAAFPAGRIAYIMTDGGALPAAFSRTVRWLRREGYLASTISAGQAFGGDYEAVNLYSALLAAKLVVGADITIVGMGPGIAGTGTFLGHSGLEQGQIINAAASLGGRPIAVLRLGQGDQRPRHQGLSHHCVSALTRAALAPSLVPMPVLDGPLADFGRLISSSLESSGITDSHEVRSFDAAQVIELLAEIEGRGGPRASTMGRGPEEEPAFFLAAGAAGLAAVKVLRGHPT